MQVILGGVRGNAPQIGADFLKYGGNTTSILIEGSEGGRILIDAGSGIRPLAARLHEQEGKTGAVLLLMTHYHLDHVMGLPTFSLLQGAGWQVTMAAPVREGIGVRRMTHRLLGKPFWPVTTAVLGSDLRFRNLPGLSSVTPFLYGGLEVRWCGVHHPQGCTAYRIDDPADGTSCVFATDAEWQASTRKEQKALLDLCRRPAPAHLLLFDGQLEAAAYPRFKGWGHSAWEDALEVARAADVGELRIIHHGSGRTDADLDQLHKKIQRASRRAGLAREGECYRLAPR
jgi:phosphoribosyl 1,2-cyclic phosphodiesterase